MFRIDSFDGEKLFLIPDSYDPFEDNLFRNMPERRWRNMGDGIAGWLVPNKRANLDYISQHWIEGKDYNITAQARLLMQYEKLQQAVDTLKSKKRWEYLFNDEKTEFMPPYVQRWSEERQCWIGKPFDHQRVAVEAMYGSEYFGCLMDMGTGKTYCVVLEMNLIALMRKSDEMFRGVVICPKSLMVNWEREIIRGFPDVYDYRIEVLDKGEIKAIGQMMELLQDNAMVKIVVVSQDSVQSLLRCLQAFKPNYGVVDESHYEKNPETKRFKAIKALFENVSMRRILTGTPIANNILDVWSQFELLRPGALGFSTYTAFKHQYAEVENWGGFERIVGFDEKKVSELKENMAKMSFIVRKDQCLDLPEKLYTVIEVDMPPKVRELYDKFKDEFCASLDSGLEMKTEHIIVQMLKLSQICSGFVSGYKLLNKEAVMDEGAEPEVEKLLEFLPGGDTKMNLMLDDIEEACKEGKVIIWSRFKLDNLILETRLKERGIDCGRYDSSTNDKSRQNIVDRFNNDDTFKAFVGNPGAGGVGLTLLGSDKYRTKTVYYYSNDFSYSKRLQSEDRCHRIGLRNPVIYKDYVYKQSIEQYIANKLQNKKDLSDCVKDIGEIKEFLLKGRPNG